MIRLVLTACLVNWLVAPGLMLAQTVPQAEIDVEEFVERVFGIQDEDLDYEALYEALFLLYQEPIDLNFVNRAELQSTFLLSELQLNNFFDYLKLNGPLLSIYELQAIPGFDPVTIQNLLPFVTIKDRQALFDKTLFQRIFSERNNFLLIRLEQTLEQKKGFLPPDTTSTGALTSRYLGSPRKIYARFRVNHSKDFSIGFTMEKDAGEQFIFDKQTSRWGMDYYSFHLHLENKGRFKSLIVGDYQIQFGQSLLLGAGFSIGKGAETITTVRRNNLGIRPHTSVMESGFFRGAAATYAINNRFDVTGFYSNINQDAQVRQADPMSEDIVSSIQASGLHRTANEINAKRSTNEQIGGLHVLYKNLPNNLSLGATFIKTQYELPIFRRPSTYNQYEFNGDMNYNFGFHGSYIWQNFNFFAEAARSKSGGVGAVGGFVASLSQSVDFSMLLRKYDRDFHSFYGHAFGENTRNINEQGIFWGIKISPWQKIYFTGYYDVFQFPWLKYRVDAPSAGFEYMVRANYQMNRNTLFYVLFRTRVKDINVNTEERNLSLVMPGNKKNYIINMDYRLNENWGFKSRIQFSSYTLNRETTQGIALAQDVNVKWRKWAFSSRIAVFDTDDYENRQYVFEKDVLYAFSIPAYQGVGIRNYVLIQYKANRKLTLWARFARTAYADREVISSGLEEIEGNVKSDVKFQVRYKF